ncbi:MAG: uracil-DNA glycosylase [Algisphaera sp.]
MSDERVHRVLRQHVETERLLGVEVVPVDLEAVAAAEPQDDAQGAAHTARVSRRSAAPVSVSTQNPVRPAIVVRPDLPELVSGNAGASLAVLDEEAVRGCTQCELHAGRSQTVFGTGDSAASLMIVGEGPNADDEQAGEPFAGEAGAFLNKQIAAMGLSRDAVYLTHLVKCRPPSNRMPHADEAAACGGFLARQVEIVSPKVILVMGGHAAKLLLGVTESITRVRGQWHAYAGPAGEIPVMATFHPTYLLRAYTPENRKKVWSDLQAVMGALEAGK